MIKIPRLLVLTLSLLLLSCHAGKVNNDLVIDGIPFISVKAFGAKGDGRSDDTEAIQRAFTRATAVYFPPGDYVVASAYKGSAHNPASLRITDSTRVSRINFHAEARLYVPTKLNYDFSSTVLIKVFADKRDMPPLRIDGLTIYAEPRSYETSSMIGLKAIEHRGNRIQHLELNNVDLRNLTSAGIITYASKNTFRNIYSENLGRHGIGARNPYNLGMPHELYVENFEDHNNRAYTMDFSGSQIGDDPSTANELDSWTATVRNIRSYNSKRGIKTAGHWNLLMEDIQIIKPKIYGFFVNKDAPNHHIKINRMRIEDAGSAGMTLNGKTNFTIKDLSIIGCKDGLLTHASKVNIDKLLIDGKGKMEKGLRISSDAEINNFTVRGTTDEYAVWIIRGDVTLRNGSMYDNESTFPVLIHREAGSVVLDKLNFQGDNIVSNREDSKSNVLSLQLKENVRLLGMNGVKVIRRQ